MARIKKLIEPLSSGGGVNEIYPVTHVRAVMDASGNNIPIMLLSTGVSYTPLFPNAVVNTLKYSDTNKVLKTLNWIKRIIQEVYISVNNATNSNAIREIRLNSFVVRPSGANLSVSGTFVVVFLNGTTTTYNIPGTIISSSILENAAVDIYSRPCTVNSTTIGIYGDPISITAGLSTYNLLRLKDEGGSLDLLNSGIMYLSMDYKHALNPVNSPNLG